MQEATHARNLAEAGQMPYAALRARDELECCRPDTETSPARHVDCDDYARDIPCAVLATLYDQHLHISPNRKPSKTEGAEITGLESDDRNTPLIL
jgi:hypothetical protein